VRCGMLKTVSVVALALTLVALASFGRHADAQIVNVQGQLAKPPTQDGITGQAELKLDWRTGNSPFFDIGGSASVLLRRGRLLVLALARGEYGNAGDVKIARKTFEHVRARFIIDCRWRWEAFAQHEYDEFRRLSVRAIAGTGPALQLVNEDRVALLAGVAYMFEAEQLDRRPPDAPDAGLRTIAHRASLYVTGTEKLGAGVSIAQTVYVQPRLDDPGDVRVLGELSLTTQLSKRVALIDGFVVAYDRTPPLTGVSRYDTQLKIGLLVTF